MTAESTTHATSRRDEPARRNRAATYRRWGGLAVLAAAATIGLAACNGGSGSPSVANLATSTTLGTNSSNSGESTTTAQPKGDSIQLLGQWAACMRGHGDPNQADPTIDANKVIHITWDPSIPGGYLGTYKGGQGNVGPGQYCRTYLTESQRALTGGEPQKPPDQAQMEKFAKCMRANRIPDFPDPSANGLQLNFAPGSDLNPSNPTFHNTATRCTQKTGVDLPGAGGTPPPGTIELNGSAVAGG